MDTLIDLGGGFASALEPLSLAFALLGVLLGTVVGVLPGIGPISAIAILIPVSFGMEPVHGLILLCGIYYGSMYGGSITATLIKTPGEVASAVTAIEGYEMARRGRGKAALATAALGSFLAGTLAIIGLTFLSPVLVKLANVFGSTEYFLLMATALLLASTMSSGSRAKALISIFIGLAVGLVGLDFQTGLPRQTFGMSLLSDGIDFTIFAMALFAIPEAIRNLASGRGAKDVIQSFGDDKWMTKQDWQRSAMPWARGSVLGFIIGILPGVGPSLASFMSYIMEKRISKRKSEFGHGAIEGVAGPEAANNAGVGGAMIPLFSLGIPGSATTALLLFVFTMYGLQPGPLIFRDESGLDLDDHRQHVHRQRGRHHLEPAARGVFVKLLKMPKEISFSSILVLVADRRLRDRIQPVRTDAARHLRRHRLSHGQGRNPTGTVHPGPRPGAAAGGQLPAHAPDSAGSFMPLLTRPVSLSIIVLMVLGIVGPIIFRWWVRRRQLLADVSVG